MPYSTLTDILKVLPESLVIQLTDDSATGVIDTEKIDKAISSADELIDGYLRGRYTLPLSPIPPLLSTISTSLAIYNLYSRRPIFEPPAIVVARYHDALRWLEQIQKGIISLGDATGITLEPGKYTTTKSREDRVFSQELLDQMP